MFADVPVPAGEPEAELAPADGESPPGADDQKKWCAPKVGKALVVSGGYLKKPACVETKTHAGSNYIQVRQYDNWLFQMVIAKSRSNRCDELDRSRKFTSMIDQCAEFAKTEDNKEDCDDPMMAVMDAVRGTGAKRKRKSQRSHNITLLAPVGINKTVSLLVPPRLCKKTLWVREEDFQTFVSELAKEFAPVESSPKTCGVFWLDGKSSWVGRWVDRNGHVEEVHRYVRRSCKKGGMQVLMGQEEWHARWLHGKERVEAVMRTRGALLDEAACVSRQLETE